MGILPILNSAYFYREKYADLQIGSILDNDSVWYDELWIGSILKVCRFIIRHITQTETQTETEANFTHKTRTFKNTNLSPMRMATLPFLHTRIVSVQSALILSTMLLQLYIHEKFSDKEITVCRDRAFKSFKAGNNSRACWHRFKLLSTNIFLSGERRTFSCPVTQTQCISKFKYKDLHESWTNQNDKLWTPQFNKKKLV